MASAFVRVHPRPIFHTRSRIGDPGYTYSYEREVRKDKN